MFIYNIKFNSHKCLKLIIVLMTIIALVFTFIAIKKTFFDTNQGSSDGDVYTIESNNYTNVLKAVHDNLDNYIGQKIKCSGYVYRVYDLKENEFIIARDMVIDSDFNTLVVGFLCHYDNKKDFKDGTWINIIGEIQKGNYHGDIPIIEINQITEIPKPADTNVYPPDDYYIPTSSLLYNEK